MSAWVLWRPKFVPLFELNDRQRQELSGDLGRLTGAQVRLRFTVDPSLIGGVMARIGSTVYDGSVRGQLAALRSRLAVTT